MQTFPVTSSILSSTHLAVFLQEKYHFKAPVRCQLLKAGINHTYFVQTPESSFVFRVYSFLWRLETEIQEEIKLLNLLKEQQVSVSFPIPDTQGAYIQHIAAPEGLRFGVLFSFAEGEKIQNYDKETHFAIGELMARFHQVSEHQHLNRTKYTPTILLKDSIEKIALFLPENTAEMQILRSLQVELLHLLSEADNTQLRKGVVHLDIWFDNLNIAPNNQITLFDFDFCGNGWLCTDVAYYVLQLHNIEKYEPQGYTPKIEYFLKGYESVSPLSPEEKRLLPALGVSLYIFYLGIQCERYENWSNSFLNENYLKRFTNGLIKRYYDIYY